MRDFTHKKYVALVHCMVAAGYRVFSVRDYLLAVKAGPICGRYVILRHDVDANPQNACRMAQAEAEAGVTATYYFRMKPAIFVPELVHAIAAQGHEVGYHYEHLSDAKGDLAVARDLFERNLREMRREVPIQTACMHGRAFSRHDNRTFWNHFSLGDFGLIGEPYLSIDYAGMHYFTDTGLRWDNDRINLRDRVNAQCTYTPRCTDDLLQLLASRVIEHVALVAHTDNWVDSPALWLYYRCLNSLANTMKRVLRLGRWHCPQTAAAASLPKKAPST